MESFFQYLAILTAGISLAMGSLSICSFLVKNREAREKVDLFFGILCFLVFIFILLPPVGFILVDNVPYTSEIKVKRIFNFSFIALLPWFISLYTGYTKRAMPVVINISLVICYGLMYFNLPGNPVRIWLLIALFILGAALVHGFYAGYRQFKNGQKVKATYLFVALSSFAVFNFLGTSSQLGNNDYTGAWDAVFFPVNLCPLVFILIMGIQLHVNTSKQSGLKKILGLREERWLSLLKDIPLIILNTDIEGRISYINPYGINLLGYSEASELVNTKWSDHCLTAQHADLSKTDHQHAGIKGLALPFYKNMVITKEGREKLISWTTDLIYNDEETWLVK